jgi:hypothetical protein
MGNMMTVKVIKNPPENCMSYLIINIFFTLTSCPASKRSI